MRVHNQNAFRHRGESEVDSPVVYQTRYQIPFSSTLPCQILIPLHIRPALWQDAGHIWCKWHIREFHGRPSDRFPTASYIRVPCIYTGCARFCGVCNVCFCTTLLHQSWHSCFLIPYSSLVSMTTIMYLTGISILRKEDIHPQSRSN